MGFEQYNDRAIITIHSDGPRGPQGIQGPKGDKGDPGEVTQEEFDDLKDQVALDKLEYTSQRQQDQLKVAKVEKDINDYKSTMASVNVNQEAKQEVTDYGTINLPKNTANGQVSASVKANTYTNLLGTMGKGDSLDGWMTKDGAVVENGEFVFDFSKPIRCQIPANIVNGHKYFICADERRIGSTGMVGVALANGENTNVSEVYTLNSNTNLVKIFTASANGDKVRFWIGGYGDTKFYIKNIRLIDLTELNDVETNLDILRNKYSYINNTKSTISASRLKSVGKNLFDGEVELGGILTADGSNVSLSGRVRSKNYIKILQGNQHVISSKSSLVGISASIYEYDKDKKYIGTKALGTANAKTFTLESNTVYIKFIATTTSLTSFYQIEKGTVATPYEPYKESTQYLPNVGELRSVPSAKDEIRVSGGKAELIKRVEKYVLQSDDILVLYTSYVNLDYVMVLKPGDYIGQDKTSGVNENTAVIDGMTTCVVPWDSIENIGKITVRAAGKHIWVGVQKGTTLEQAKTTLVGTELTYQLAEPIITPIEVTGNLVSYPSGTVYVENVVADAGIYDDGISVLHQDLPISEVEKLSKVDFITGVETDLDVSECEVSEDSLSFTHPNLTDGDIVFFTYYYDLESTLGETTLEYYDSRYVLEDDVTGKFYKIVPKVSDGVLTNELVEV